MSKVDFKNLDNEETQDFSIPNIGIEDVDRAVFQLFDKDINFETIEKDDGLRKVPVVFAAGERFALTRRKNPIRDRNNTLILPLIAIERSNIKFSGLEHNAITTSYQPNYTIRKRLAKSDRDYQNIVNKHSLINQDNVSSRKNYLKSDISPGNIAAPGTVATRRQKNAIKFSKSGGMISLDNNNALGDNIFEIINVPYPIQIEIKYTVNFWCQYMSQLNQLQETLLSRITSQRKEFLVKTDKGLEYVISIGGEFANSYNFNDFTNAEREIKATLSLNVLGYIINPRQPGIPNQVRSTFSAPNINFEYNNTRTQVVVRENPNDRDMKKFMLNDIETEQQKNGDLKRGQSSEELSNIEINPFTGEEYVAFSKVLDRNSRAGETVLSNLIVKKIETQYE
jgi:hypothetical protein